jgi:hypothetical protein
MDGTRWAIQRAVFIAVVARRGNRVVTKSVESAKGVPRLTWPFGWAKLVR